MRKKVTIEDISRLTGLSRGTISRALNNRPDISEATRQKVLAACRKLHYTPSFAARSLATGRHLAIAVLVPARVLGSVGAFVAALARHAAGRQFVTVLVPLPDEKRELTAGGTELPTGRVDGAVLAGPVAPQIAPMLRRRLGSLPCVICVEDVELPGDVIVPDVKEAGRLAVRMLADRARCVVCLVRPVPAQQRFAEAVRDACKAAGLRAEPWVLEPGGRLSAEKLAASLDACEAVICGDDALGALTEGALMARGRTVGKQVLIIGHGNSPLCDQLPVPLTSIDPDPVQIARRALEILEARIDKRRRDAPTKVLVPPRLAIRASCPTQGTGATNHSTTT